MANTYIYLYFYKRKLSYQCWLMLFWIGFIQSYLF